MEVAPKRTDVRQAVEAALRESGQRVRFSEHAELRLEERIFGHPSLSVRDVFRVLRKGRRDEERDEWNHELCRWSYCFSGSGVDGVPVRVPIAFVEPGILIVTVVLPGDPDW